MNTRERILQHEQQVRDLYTTRPALLRAHRGNQEKLKKVEEFIALQEEQLALSNDHDQSEHRLKFCDTDTTRGKAQHAEYTRMCERARARIEEIVPRIEALKKEVEIKEEDDS